MSRLARLLACLALMAISSLAAVRLGAVADADVPSPAAPALTVVLQQGLNGYTGAEDTYLSAWQPDTPQWIKNPLQVRPDAFSPLLRFDLSPIPGYAVITEALLELYVTGRGGYPGGTFTMNAYRVLRPWVHTEATWDEARQGVRWTMPGCNGHNDREATPFESLALGDIDRWYTLDVTTLAQGWLADPSSNHGVLLQGESIHAIEYWFASAQHWLLGNRPRLVVTYTFAGPTPTPTGTATATPTKTATATSTRTPTPTATPLPRAVQCHAVESLLPLEGDATDWGPVPSIYLDWYTADGHWPVLPVSPSDCSVTIKTVWDEWNLYFGFVVQDDVVMPVDNDPDHLWHDDSVGIAIDGNDDRVWGSAFDHKFIIDSAGRVFHDGQVAVNVVARARWLDGFGYAVEIAIPWASLVPGGIPRPGLTMGVNFDIHDDDDRGDYDHWFVWEGRTLDDPTDLGPMALYGDGPWYRTVYQQGRDGFYGVHDTYISIADAHINFGTQPELLIGYDGNVPREEEATLIRFDLPPLPQGAFITRAVLNLYASAYRGNPDLKIFVYRILGGRRWVDTQATWYLAATGIPWGQPGCNDTTRDIYYLPSDELWIHDVDTWYGLDVTRMVHQWVTGSEPNQGLAVKGWFSGSRQYTFVSSDRLFPPELRPKLEVTWRFPPPTPTYTPTATATRTQTPTCTPTPTITATPTETATLTPSVGAIAGVVFEDSDGNYRQDAGEKGVAGAIIRLFDRAGVVELDSRTTGSDGRYAFHDLAPDWYGVREEGPPGYQTTTLAEWTVYVAPGWITEINFPVRLVYTVTPTASPTVTASSTPTATPSPTWTYTATPTPTSSETATLTPTWTSTLTGTPTSTLTDTPTNTRVPTSTPTETLTQTPTWTWTATSTFTPTPTHTRTPSRTLTPSRTPIPTCVVEAYALAEDFDAALAGWEKDMASGRAEVVDSVLKLSEKSGGTTMFPLLWRNDAFPAGDFAFEARFRFSGATPYGVTIGVGSQPYDGTRYLEEEPPIPGIEDILSVHCFDESYHILLIGRKVWESSPDDESWHTFRLVKEGTKYTLLVDGAQVLRVASPLHPASLYLGNPTIERFSGFWTHLEVDRLHVSYCAAWSEVYLHLPLLLKVR